MLAEGIHREAALEEREAQDVGQHWLVGESGTIRVPVVHHGQINIYFGIRIPDFFKIERQGSEKLWTRTDISRY